ncbi:MAG: DUF3656 domain-containing protein [Methanobrevibacter sp.]|jgi:putative protease|nr:DUF3656 domain-containing protein [Methanobrevibacter sp.]
MSLELLAPAGSYEIFKIAVNAGADAVYLSGKKYGARAFAENFTIEEIKKSVEYAHLNNVKVFITANTLINNFEVVDFLKYVFKLYKIGVDGIIVQDFGIMALIKRIFPKISVHGSTQTTLNNYYSVLWGANNGLSRVIFPRELSLDEISNISKKLKEAGKDIELEVFSHGAICYSISGNCYISSFNHGRSGNRGACTQPCRREYILKYNGHKIDKGYLLSTHDLNVSDDLDKIIEAGVDSIKLEGRMKSEDYVRTIVNSYRNIIDKKEGNFKEDLNMVFNRKFTKGYLLDQTPGEVMGRESSGHLGYYIGEIEEIVDEYTVTRKNKNENKSKNKINNENKSKSKKSNTNNSKSKKNNKNKKKFENNNTNENENEENSYVVKEIKIKKESPIEIRNGDGIAFKMGEKVKGVYISNITEQTDKYIIFKTSRNVRKGDKVYISYSQTTHKEIKKYKQEQISPKIAISFDMELNEELNLIIKAKFNLDNRNYEYDYKSKVSFEKAINRPMPIEEIKKQLSKTGNTPFYIEKIDINNYPNDLFIPTSKLNKIRREVLERGTKILVNHYKPDKNQINITNNRLKEFIKNYNWKDSKDQNKQSTGNKPYTSNKEENPNNSITNEQNNIIKKTGISVFVDNLNLIKIASNYPIQKIYFDTSFLYNNPTDYFENIENILTDASSKASKIELVWVLPSFISDEEIAKCKNIFKKLESKGVPISIMIDVPGISDLFDTNVYGNQQLNVWNSFTCENLKNDNFNSLILSPELSYDEIKELIKKNNQNKINIFNENKENENENSMKDSKDIGLELIVHGNLEVIVSKDDFSNLKDGKNLNIKDPGDYAILEDKKRKKFKYRVFFDFNKKSHIINKDCLCLIDELDKIKSLELDNIILDCRFTNENYSSQIISLYLEGLKTPVKNKLNNLKKEISELSHSYLSKGNFIDGRIHEKS